ncbi:MAG TPA: DUF4124 domain-containing protein [Geobacterales bacterium]|nr:DUF4124 domain-containing protein [Geobacterales bacterium]
MRMILTLSLVLLLACPVVAATYRWTDARGTINFTDDVGNIPERYRERAVLVGAEQTPTTEVIESSLPEPPPNTEGGGNGGTPAPPSAEVKKPVLYGDKEGTVWGQEFSTLRREIDETTTQIAEQKGRLANSANLSRAEYRGIESEIKRLEERQADRQRKYDELKSRALKVGVPSEFIK